MGVIVASSLPGILGLIWLLMLVVGIEVTSAGDAAEKFVRVASTRGEDYRKGVTRVSPAKFEQAAQAGADNWAQGVTQAAAEGRFAAGVQGAGQRWARKADQIGSVRFGPGVQASREDYSAGVQPYFQAMQGLELPPRRPRGDPSNIQRVAAIAQTLNETRRRR